MDFLSKETGRNLSRLAHICADVTTLAWRHPKLTRSFLLQGAQHLLINIPFLQDRKNRLRPETCARELPENPRRMLLIFWFLQSFATQKLPRLLLFIDVFVRSINS